MSIYVIVALIIVVIGISFMIGKIVTRNSVTEELIDLFCVFLRIHQNENELLKSFKDFLIVYHNDKSVLENIKNDLKEEGK